MVGPPQDLAHYVQAAKQVEIILDQTPDIAADRADPHVEGPGTPRDRLTDPPIAENAERLASQFRPHRRDREPTAHWLCHSPRRNAEFEPGEFAG